MHIIFYQWHGTIIVQGLREYSSSLDRENNKQLIEISQLLQSLNFIPTFEIHFEKAPSNLLDHDNFQPAQQEPEFLSQRRSEILRKHARTREEKEGWSPL